MTFKEQLKFMKDCKDKNVLYIIFYASDWEKTLKPRLFGRGDTQEVLDNSKEMNDIFTFLGKYFENLYDNVKCIDITKEPDQIKWFEKIKNNLEREER